MYPRIRHLREDQDLNQTTIAGILNINQTTYSRYERGTLDIPSATLIKLAQYYQTSVDDLLGLTEGNYTRFERIRSLREENDYTQIQVANYLGVKQSTYSNYENGIMTIPIESFIKLAQYYNTSVDYLVGLTDIQQPYAKNKI